MYVHQAVLFFAEAKNGHLVRRSAQDRSYFFQLEKMYHSGSGSSRSAWGELVSQGGAFLGTLGILKLRTISIGIALGDV